MSVVRSLKCRQYKQNDVTTWRKGWSQFETPLLQDLERTISPNKKQCKEETLLL